MSLIECFDDLDDSTANLIIQLHLQDLHDLAAQGVAENEYDESSGASEEPEVSLPVTTQDEVSAPDHQAAQAHQVTGGDQGSASNTVPNGVAAPAVPVICAIHLDELSQPDTFRASCGCHYCRDAINDIFRRALSGNETYWPPQCCGGRIYSTDAQNWLTPEVFQEYCDKREEFDDQQRVYCHARECSKYIGRAHRYGTFAVCPECYETTCLGSCKGPRHPGDCPQDDGITALEELASREGWRRCPDDGRMIAKESGCNHMTCNCGCEFCYLCGKTPWHVRGIRQCDCPQFEYDYGEEEDEDGDGQEEEEEEQEEDL